jgi:hypothetical protein
MLTTLLATALVLADTTRGPRAPYWQQEVAYDIVARLDEPSATLAGTERIRYVNRSPDTLTTFSLHLHLNAFRPGSRWSAVDAREQRKRFGHLQEPDFAFNHVRDVRIMGEPATATYPFAPDSTIVRFDLPRPLAPGAEMTVEMEWDARPSTTPRRQGRKGRHYDFAHWYPKVVVYDKHGWQEKPLEPAGEFYGEFATWRVQLDVAADQVVGATGVPVCGDPGWERDNRGGRAVQYGREAYGRVLGPGCAFPADFPSGAAPAAGDKRILWYARDVHNFALSVNPEYRYEGGQWGTTLIHVLYRPGDDSTWSKVAVERTAIALAWLDKAFGPYAWPQITNLHRLDGGGTEFPMVIMDGSAGQGLILHELGHNYVMGILASNEWREAWLDEGFSDFQGSLFDESEGRQGPDPEAELFLLRQDLDGESDPTSLPSQAYRDFNAYGTSAYVRGAGFLERLRYVVGDDAMRRTLREYYRRWKLKHVDEEAFREVTEESSGMDLTTFFAQELHQVALKDYAVGKVERQELGAEGWMTRVEVKRRAEGIVPVEVFVYAERDTAMARADGLQPSEWVEIRTASKPREVWLDPRIKTGDWNMLNNRHRFGGDPASAILLFHPQRPATFYFDTWFTQQTSRDRLTQGWMPMAWYNDVGGVTLGVRSRDDYLGRYERNQFWLSYSLGEPDAQVRRLDFFLRAKDPVWARAPGFSPTFEAFRIEGRWGGLLRAAWERRAHQSFGPTHTMALSLRLVGIDDDRFLDPGQYEPVGIAELALEKGVSTRSNGWRLAAAGTLGFGLVFDREELDALGRERDQYFYRATLEGTARRRLGAGKWLVGGRAFVGVAGWDAAAPLQRQMFVANPDPFGQLNNPFVRSRGALMVGDDMAYHAPGGGNVRGADFRVASPGLASLNAELEFEARRKPRGGVLNRLAFAGFADAAQGFGADNERPSSDRVEFLADAGVGIRASHRIGDTPFETRLDFPVYLSEPAFARNEFARDEALDFRWVFSVQAAF